MTSGSRFTRYLSRFRPTIALTLDGKAVEAQEGDSVAAAILLSNQISTRATPIHNKKRGPYCMMGACYECLVEINGVPNQQACMITVTEGMIIRCKNEPSA